MLLSRPANDPELLIAEAAVRDAEKAYRNDLFARLHARRRSALCFSGGGIRSSTFSLGILQGLAAYSKKIAGERPKLLGEIDFLSTVSGGGYVGSWFSAWATRLAKPGKVRLRNDMELDERDGPSLVMEELASSPDSTFEPEPLEVHHLREYSNYLAPKRSVFSADTWALVAHVVRNMFLNWLVLIPLFAAALLAPILTWRLLWLRPAVIPHDALWYLIISSFVYGSASVGYVGYDLPNAGNARRTTKRFFLLCLLPLMMSAIHLNIFWAWLPRGHPSAAWWDVVSLGKIGLHWWHFSVFGAAMHGGGMLAGIVYVMLRFKRPAPHIGLAATVAAAFTGFLGGFAALFATHFVTLNGAWRVAEPRAYAVLAFPVVVGIFLLSQTLLVGAGSYITEDEDREWWARSGGWLIAVSAGWLVFAYLVLFSIIDLKWANAKLSAAFTAATGLTGWAASRAGKSPDTSSGNRGSDSDKGSDLFSSKFVKEYGGRLLLPVFVALLTILLGAADINLVHWVRALPDIVPSFWPSPLRPMGMVTAHALWVLVAELLVCLIASYFININKFSLHGMYRLRLIRAFLGGSNRTRNPNMFTGFDENDNMSMSSLTGHRPLHVINMALNLVHGKNLAWQERKAEPFTCTRLHTGSCRVGYRSSANYGGRYTEHRKKSAISLGTAMTISGAAASPNMGYHSSPLLTLVMTLFNARLGWWLGNPRSAPSVWKRPGPRWGIRPFIDEAFGLTDDQNDWLYLSDGGHFENLGIYEMVLRRCRLIIACDASADPGYNFEDLANAVRKVRVDLGIPIECRHSSMPMSPARHPTDENSGHHCAIARIGYSAVDNCGPEQDGVLLYIKASLNGNETADIQHYSAMHTLFPQEPTSDQFYDEAQFESYRRLGLHIIEEICGSVPDAEKGLDLDQFLAAVQAYLTLPVPSCVCRVGVRACEIQGDSGVIAEGVAAGHR